MDPLTTTAAAGLRSRLEALDLLANNLANSSTPGFKADREAYGLYLSEDSMGADASGLGLAQATAPVIEVNRTDLSQGQITVTGLETDLALSGAGFFQVDGPAGPLITRNGRVQITAEGKLTTKDGYELTTVEPQRIRANPQIGFNVDSEGVVRQQGRILGRLKIVDYDFKAQAPKREGVYFALDSKDLPALKASRAEVFQGKLESSNTSPPESAVRLVGILRQFESLQKAIQLGGEMGRRAIEEVAKVNP